MEQAWDAAGLVQQVEIHNKDALTFLREMLQRPIEHLGRVVVYCDPPHPLDSRKSQRLIYNHQMTDQQHIEFLRAVHWLRVDCLVSTCPNELYADQLSHGNRTEFQSQTRKGPATEWLLYNYSTTQVLHDDSYSVSNYWERKYFKRQAARGVCNFRKMPAHEQQTVLRQLINQAPHDLIQQLLPQR